MKTLKTLAIFCLGALLFTGCEGTGPDDNGGNGSASKLVISVDKNTIYNDGEDAATFTLYNEGVVVEDGYEIYYGETPIEGNVFTSTTMGTYEFWAACGTLISNTVNVNVVSAPPAAPAAPEDTNPEKTGFVRRVLLTQFTGTGCPNCPYMINGLYNILSNDLYKDKVVVAAAHLYNESDPAYLAESKTLDNAMNAQYYPSVYANLDKNSATLASAALDAELALLVNTYYTGDAKGGIAVNSEYHADKGYVVLTATVKAASTREFRIGAWLLEDNIAGEQKNNGVKPVDGVDFNTHNNCIRIADSKFNLEDFSGHALGTIEAGKTASREFAFALKANGKGGKNYWNHDNLRVIVFISTNENGKWLVNNVVKCPKDGYVDFEYTE